MTVHGCRSGPSGFDRRCVRLAGGILLADGLLRIAGSRGVAWRPLGNWSRSLDALETALGLALLDRAPLEPESLYRAVAPVYDRLSPVWRDWLYRDALGAFDAAIVTALPPGGDVLDLGCGTGAVLERLIALDAPFGTYTGVDVSSPMLARARDKLSHVPGARFGRLDLRTEPLPDGPFDLVVSAWVLEHLRDPGSTVMKARDRLRPGGRIVLLFELDGQSMRGSVLRRLWRFFGAPLVAENDTRCWPGLVLLRRLPGLGPDVGVATLAAEPGATAT